MNRANLRHARAIMERVERKELPFNMGVWFWDRGHPMDRGTAACFMGWCARDPDFQKQGLYVSYDGMPTFKDASGWGAAALLFDIPRADAKQLIFPESYISDYVQPRDVINRIDALLARDTEEKTAP